MSANKKESKRSAVGGGAGGAKINTPHTHKCARTLYTHTRTHTIYGKKKRETMHLCVPAKKKQWGRPPRRVKRENEKKTMNEFFLAVFVLKEKKEDRTIEKLR